MDTIERKPRKIGVTAFVRGTLHFKIRGFSSVILRGSFWSFSSEEAKVGLARVHSLSIRKEEGRDRKSNFSSVPTSHVMKQPSLW